MSEVGKAIVWFFWFALITTTVVAGGIGFLIARVLG